MNIIKPSWPQPSNVNALLTLKNCSQEDFNNIVANHTNPNKPNTMFSIKQQHGINIVYANYNTSLTPEADGSFTQEKNIICLVKTADCLPILVTNKQGDFVSALHAGWRGLSSGIIENFFVQTKPLNLITKDLLFWFGPAIGSLAFEVGEDVLEKFSSLHPSLYKDAFKPILNKNNKYLANIYELAKLALSEHGVNNNQIFANETWCTYSQAGLFCSYRREPTSPNRMYSLIWMESERSMPST